MNLEVLKSQKKNKPGEETHTDVELGVKTI